MLLLSPFLKRIAYPSLSKTGYLHRFFSGAVAVVTYHGVLPAGYLGDDAVLDGALLSRERFVRQLRLLKSRFAVITPDKFLDGLRGVTKLPQRSVLITCDDGLLNHASEMLPILLEERLSCLFFVTGKSVAEPYSLLWYIELYLMLTSASEQNLSVSLPNGGIQASLTTLAERRKVWVTLMRAMSRLDEAARYARLAAMATQLGLPTGWKDKYEQGPQRERFCVMGIPELRQLIDSGMAVGAHSRSHPVPSEQSDELWRDEVRSSRELLQQALHQPVWAFAYPFGDAASVQERQYRLAEEEGFACAFRNAGGPVQALAPGFNLPRIHVSAEMTTAEFEAHVSGFYDSLRQRLGRA